MEIDIFYLFIDGEFNWDFQGGKWKKNDYVRIVEFYVLNNEGCIYESQNQFFIVNMMLIGF